MYPAPFDYHRATSINDAIELLQHYGDEGRAIAGGQSLLVLMKMRFDQPSHLIDLGRIPNLDSIENSNGKARIGALATHAQIARSDLTRAVPIVGDAANGIADNQVRSRGTIGGSVASGDPSCDWPPLLHTVDATIHTMGPQGERHHDINGFVADLYETVLQTGEIVTGIEFDVPTGGGAYCAFKRAAPAYPTVSMGIQMSLKDSDTVEKIRVAMASVGMTPIRSITAETELTGRPLSIEAIQRAADAAVSDCEPVDDQRGSAEYKQQIIATLFKRAVSIAQRRCDGEIVNNQHEYY